MDIAITSIGTANPAYKRNQQDAAELVAASLHLSPAEKRLLKSIYKNSGIEHRYSVLKDYIQPPGAFEFFPNQPDASFPSTSARMKIYKENALPLALEAIHQCLATQDKSKITHLITVSCTGMYAPGIDIEITQILQFNSSIQRTCINFMGCYGAFNAIKVAAALCKADPKAKVLVVAVELCTIHLQKKSSIDNFISNAIFADGAAAAVIEANPEQSRYFSLQDFHCDLVPQSSDSMAWAIADSGFDIILSSYVPEVIRSGIKKFSQQLLEKYKIDLFAIHPGGIKILQACEQELNMTAEQNKYAYSVLRQYGNMSSATVLFVLKAIWDDMSVKERNKNIFCCAFGPGLTLESMVLRTDGQ